MAAAGIDAFVGNTSEELAMANLISMPTVVRLPCSSPSDSAVQDSHHLAQTPSDESLYARWKTLPGGQGLSCQ